MVAKYYFQ